MPTIRLRLADPRRSYLRKTVAGTEVVTGRFKAVQDIANLLHTFPGTHSSAGGVPISFCDHYVTKPYSPLQLLRIIRGEQA